MRSAATVLVLALATSSAAIVRADEKAQCVDAYKRAQLLRKNGDYTGAREQLLVCSRESCPAIVKQDCLPWLGEVARGIASVVVKATDQSGKPLDAVTVTIDGKTVATHLDGRPIEVSPGTRAIRVETEGAPPVESSVTLKEGEKSHAVEVVLAIAAKRAPTPPADSSPIPVQSSRPVPAGAIALGVVGVVGLGAFATLGLLGRSKQSSLDACKPACDPEDVSGVRTDYIAADVAAAVGGAALAGALVWFLVRPEVTEPSRGATVGLLALPGGGFFALAHGF